jgi:hypothetical protein
VPMWGGGAVYGVTGGVAAYIKSLYGDSKLFYHLSLSYPFLPSNVHVILRLELAGCVIFGNVHLSN